MIKRSRVSSYTHLFFIVCATHVYIIHIYYTYINKFFSFPEYYPSTNLTLDSIRTRALFSLRRLQSLQGLLNRLHTVSIKSFCTFPRNPYILLSSPAFPAWKRKVSPLDPRRSSPVARREEKISISLPDRGRSRDRR